MLQQLTIDEFKALSSKNKRVAVSREIYGDMLTPVAVFRTLAAGRSDAALLDSSEHSTASDACIYIGLDPVAEFRATANKIDITVDGKTTTETGNVLQQLREFYQQYRCASLKTLAKFAGGMIGFLSYDAVRLIENIFDRHPNEDNIPDVHFTFYGTHIVFDKRSGKATIVKVVEVKDDIETSYQTALDAIDAVIEKMMAGAQEKSKAVSHNNADAAEITSDLSDDEFATIVEKAKDYIRQGEAFQVVTSRRFQRSYQGDDFDVYRALRVLNPSPYQFYIRNKDFTMVGSSPERLVSMQSGVVETMPIAGTRPRGGTYDSDIKLEKELQEDEKEMAEHMMLVDLGRNDVGAISEPGSVAIAELASVHRYSRVMHIVSRVQGKLADDKDAFDVLNSVFPAGTLSGAPKIRAMEIIDELETSRRGVYGGAVVAIDNEGQMDSCITIRTVFIKEGIATVRAGAGVVLDSDPLKEAAETRHKAQAVLDALELAERGVV